MYRDIASQALAARRAREETERIQNARRGRIREDTPEPMDEDGREQRRQRLREITRIDEGTDLLASTVTSANRGLVFPYVADPIDPAAGQKFQTAVRQEARFRREISPAVNFGGGLGSGLGSGLGGGGGVEDNAMHTISGPTYDRGGVVKIVPSGHGKDEIWLEVIHQRDAYGTAFNSAMAGGLFHLPGGDILISRISRRDGRAMYTDTERTTVGLATHQLADTDFIGDEPALVVARANIHIYDERGKKMTWKMYDDRWDTIFKSQTIDPSVGTLFVCEYVELLASNTKTAFRRHLDKKLSKNVLVRAEFTDDEEDRVDDGFTELRRGGLDPHDETLLDRQTLIVQFHLADIMKKIEGFYVMKNRPIGDVTEPLYVGFAGMMWKVRGYLRLTARVVAEIAQLETLLGDWFRGQTASGGRGPVNFNLLLLEKELIAPLAQLLDTMLVYRYTSHQQPYDMKAVERCGRLYENLCDGLIRTLKRVFSIV